MKIWFKSAYFILYVMHEFEIIKLHFYTFSAKYAYLKSIWHAHKGEIVTEIDH